MSLYYQDESVTVLEGDCVALMATLADESVDAVVCDPPYGLEFMGKDWDRFAGKVSDRDFKGFVLSQQRTRNVKCPECGKWAYDHPGRLCECGGIRRAQGSTFQQWCETWAVECLRVLKPGGHMAAFGGTRTWHRLAVAIEDAGFEIRDNLAWLYGSGFPKSLDVSKAIDKAAGAEREPDGYSGPNHLNAVYGNGMGGGVTTSKGDPVTPAAAAAAAAAAGWGTALKPAFEPIVLARKPLRGTVVANWAEYGTGALNINACRVACDVNPSVARRKGATNHLSTRPAREAEAEGKIESRQSPEAFSADRPGELLGRFPANVLLDEQAAVELDQQSGILTSGANPTRRGADSDRTAYGEFGGQAEW